MSNEENQIIKSDSKKNPFYKIIFLFVLIGLMGYLGYDLFMRIKHSTAQWDQKIQQTRFSISDMENKAESQQKTIEALSDEVAQIKQTFANSLQHESTFKEKLLVEEIKYLVKLAEFNLRYRHSITEAIHLLQLADQEVRDKTDPRFTEVRKALAEDMATLQGMPVVDVTGIYLRLLALNEKVDQLPLVTKPVSVNVSLSAENDKNLSWWKKGLHHTWDILRHLVVVRYNTSDTVPFIAPEQQAYVYQNWHAMLIHAMSALLQGQADIYQSSLQQIELWIKEYSVMDSPLTTAFLAEITQLKTINIHPEIPTLSRSLQAVDTLKVS